MCAIFCLQWNRGYVNFLLKKNHSKIRLKWNYWKLYCSPRVSVPLAINSQLSRGSLVRSSRNASEGSVIRFRYPKFTSDCTCPRWLRSSACHFDHPIRGASSPPSIVPLFFPFIALHQRKTQFSNRNLDKPSITIHWHMVLLADNKKRFIGKSNRVF